MKQRTRLVALLVVLVVAVLVGMRGLGVGWFAESSDAELDRLALARSSDAGGDDRPSADGLEAARPGDTGSRSARRRSDSAQQNESQVDVRRATLELRVVDPASAPISGAFVARRGAAKDDARMANADGLVVLERPPAGETLVLDLSADGFLATSITLVEESGARETVVLQPSGRISGFVTDEANAALAGVLVYAIPAFDLDELESGAVASFLRDFRGPKAETDAAGAFRLEGVEPGVRYHVSCAAPGRVCLQPDNRARSGKNDVRLAVAPAFGALVHFQRPDGARVTGRPGTTGSMAALDPEVTLVAGHAITKLLGLALFIELPELSMYDTLLLAVGPSDVDAVGRIRLQRSFPGHAPIDVEVELPSCRGGLGEIVVPIDEGPAGLGTVRVVFPRELDRLGARSGQARGVGELRLVPKAGGGETIKTRLRAAADGPTLVEGVPYGEYRASFANGLVAAHFRTPEVDLTVGPVEAIFELDGGSTGVLELVQDGTGESGALRQVVISIGKPVPAPGADRTNYQLTGMQGSTYCAFLNGPYRVPFLAPGEYAIAVEEPGFSFGGREWTLATVRDGEVTRVECSVER